MCLVQDDFLTKHVSESTRGARVLYLVLSSKYLEQLTATESWTLLKSEFGRDINRYVSMKKQGKRSKKKQLSKEAFKKSRYKQEMWPVYKHTERIKIMKFTKRH